MNPIFQWMIALTARKSLSRKCPYCGGINPVPQALLKEPIRCRQCAREIPPN